MLATLVVTFWLYGGLNQVTFLLRCLLVFVVGVAGWGVGWCPLFSRASLYAGIALLNSSVLQDSEAILLVMALGNCLIMFGG